MWLQVQSGNNDKILSFILVLESVESIKITPEWRLMMIKTRCLDFRFLLRVRFDLRRIIVI